MFNLERLFPDIVFSSNSLISYLIKSSNKWCRHIVGCQVEKKQRLPSPCSRPFWAQILLNQPWQWVKEVETCCCCVFKNTWVMIWRIHIILRVGYDPMVMFFISFCARICWCRSHDQSKCPWWPCWFSASGPTGHCNNNDWSSGGQLIINRVINPSWGIHLFFSPQSYSYLYFILFIVVVVVVVFVLIVWLWLACCATALWL